MKTKKLKIRQSHTFAKALSPLLLLAFSVLFLSFSSIDAFAQVVAEPRPDRPLSPIVKIRKAPRRTKDEQERSTEKSIAAEANVNISLCVSEGNVKINGWERNEIRAFVDGGAKVGFKVLERRNQSPVWVMVTGYDTQKTRETGTDECLTGDEIELDVPRGATVNIKGGEADVSINSVERAKIEIGGGDIRLNDIRRGIESKTYAGDLTVENSGGAMTLSSTNGSIVVFDTRAAEVGDVFKAKTGSGAITLQKVEHRQIEVGSNSGSIRFDGALAIGGQYAFSTTNGSILLTIPPDASCRIQASYGGVFQTEIPLKNAATPVQTSLVKSTTGILGAGDAAVALTTLSGAIKIKKK